MVGDKHGYLSSKRRLTIMTRTLAYTLCIIGGAILMIPFLWMLSTSLKQSQQIFKYPIIWLPNPIVWRNYIDAFNAVPFLRYIRNTIVITFSSILGDIITCSLVAYSFARLRYPGRDFLFILLLSTLMIPYPVTLIPTFLIYKYLNWIDTYIPLILPAYFAYPFWVFLLRQYLMTIPLELDDAAKIDGCGYLNTYLRILFPLSKPVLTTIAIFSFMAHWNDFLRPLIYINTSSKYTLALGLRSFQGLYLTRWELVMAASVIAMMPCLIIFFFAQKYFIQGIVISGVKG